MTSLQRYSTGGRTYWRIVESYRDKGRPKLRLVKHLGSADDILALLASEERRFEVRSVAHGAVASLLAAAEELGVVGIIDAAVASFTGQTPQRRNGLSPGQSCLLIALGRACHPTSKRGWHRWARATSLPDLWQLRPEELDSQFFWDQMNEVPLEVLPQIEERLAAKAIELAKVPLDLLMYDTTNVFTVIASTNTRPTLPQRGWSKQKRHDLRQVGLALLVSRAGQLPLWHHVYQGNEPDVVRFPAVLTALRERIQAVTREVADITLVCDRGNNASKDNQALVDGSELHYVAALTPSNHLGLIEEANRGLEPVEVRQGEVVQSWRARRPIWEAERTVVVYVSERLRAGQIRGLNQHLSQRLKQLTTLAEALRKPRARRRTREQVEQEIERLRQGQFVHRVLKVGLVEHAPGRWTLDPAVDAAAYDDLVTNYLGRRVLITDRHDWSTAEILRAYRAQCEVEACFEHLKDPFHLAARPQYHWTDQKIAVHVWCCVLAYLLVRLVHLRLTERTGYTGTIHTMLEDLGQIRRATVLHKQPGKKGRPRIAHVLDHPDDPQFAALVTALDLRA
ncbi:MAG TPA: IS1634 family transposase [Thermoanaerobaculaceae bacterium]|nr:IS1634 family transposase [Thermoanaerobaculaceae bacterium]HRS16972.1 IS1634 family transposase [Thermoanaerobaculaceae bacterium]